jgi:hypothetical protein
MTLAVNHCSVLRDYFDNIDELSDFELKFSSGKSIHVHKIILLGCSEYFKDVIESSYFETTEDECLTRELIKSVYTSELSTTEENKFELLTLASKYKMKLQETHLTKTIVDTLTHQNMLQTYVFGKANNEEIYLNARQFVRNNLQHLRGEHLAQLQKFSLDELKEFMCCIDDSFEFCGFAQDAIISSWEDFNGVKLDSNAATSLPKFPSLEWTFDVTTIPNAYKLVNNTTLVGVSTTNKRMAFIHADLQKNPVTTWRIKVLSLSNWVGVGVGMKSVVMRNRETASSWSWSTKNESRNGQGHGVWMVSNNTSVWDTLNEKTNHRNLGFLFDAGDTLELTYTRDRQELQISCRQFSYTFQNVPPTAQPVVDTFDKDDKVCII